VEHRIGEGGMGVVYRAHQVRLNRGVAIKVLKPALFTAEGAEAFLREAHTLADVKHPNVIVIHDTGDNEGLQYYIMEFVNGSTLERRLEAGPLRSDEVVGIGIDLLRGLQSMHRLGFVHRDIKPSNVFVLSDRALLGDFGIARPPSTDESDPHNRDGTAEYMAPEQVEGKPVTPRTDIYSTGVILYEAISGRGFHEQGERVDWKGIPHDLAGVLQQATAKNPAERWSDARSFSEALEQTQGPDLWRLIEAIGGRATVVGAALVAIRILGHPGPPPANPSHPRVAFDAIDYVGPAGQSAVADSLARLVRSDLRDHIFFVDSAALAVRARMTVTDGDVGLRISGTFPTAEFHVPLERWSTLSDSVSYQIVLGVWADRSPILPLPRRALPRTTEGLAQFMEAEQLVAQTEWKAAYDAYKKAVATDPTCWICLWRMTEVERWLSIEPDPERVRQYLTHADSLPRSYASLIRSAQLSPNARLDTLRAVTDRDPQFFLGWFQLGDELFHRGPLVGHRRSEAIPAFERAARLRPDFGPAWEHLAWVATAEGDSASAASALDSLQAHSGVPDPFSAVLRALLRLGFEWRFFPPSEAQPITVGIANSADAQSSPILGAGPRMLATFDAPRGAIALGQILEQNQQRDVRRSALIAEAMGSLTLGRLEDAQRLAGKAADVSSDAELDLFTAELQGALALLEGGSIADALNSLHPWSVNKDTKLRERATWLSALLEHRAAVRPGAARALQDLLTADSLAAAGQPRAALKKLDRTNVDSVARSGNPFFRAVVHFQRADWRERIGDIAGARDELVWHEHLDVVGVPTGLPQAADVDWAFGTLARWRLARLLDRAGRAGRAERGWACEAYAAVVRQWSGAPAPYGARADTARGRAVELSCTALPAR
jgi:serine/threonine protein kinase